MYKIIVESPLFKNKAKVDQHRMVTDVISEELKEIHGFNLKTREPKE